MVFKKIIQRQKSPKPQILAESTSTYLTKRLFLYCYFTNFVKLSNKFNNLKFYQYRMKIYFIYLKKQSASIHIANQKFTAK